MLIYLFFLLTFSLFGVDSSVESFEQKLSRVRYGDLRGPSRIEAYQDLLKSINRGFASEPETHEFVTNVLGILRQRPTSDATTLRLLSELIKSILNSRVVILQGHAKDFAHWKEVLEGDLRKFALTHGDIVRVRLQNSPEKCLSVVGGEKEPRLDMANAEGLQAFFRLGLCLPESEIKDNSLITGGNKIDLTPLYWGRSGVDCALCDDYSVQFQGDVLSRTPVISILKKESHNPTFFEIRKREKIPAYSHEPLMIAHHGCGEWPALLEKVSEESLTKLENDNIQQALARIKVMPTHLDKIQWLKALAGNFNARISEKNIAALLKQLLVLMNTKSHFDHQTLLAARQLIQHYQSMPLFHSHDHHFIDWLKGINQLLEPHAIKFGAIIKIATKNKGEEVLCAAPHIRGGTREYSKEIRLGVGPEQGSKQGHNLMTLTSPVGKQGAITIGDEIELSLPHIDGTTELRCVLSSADSLGEARVLGLSALDIDADSDATFILEEGAPGLSKKQPMGTHLVSGDPFIFRSKKSHKILGFRPQHASLWTKIEPYDENALKKGNIVSQFCINLLPADAVSNVVTKSFYDKLQSIHEESSSYSKIIRLMALLETFSPMISVQDQDVFWDVVSNILMTKKYMHEHELTKTIDLLHKIILIARVNNITQWSRRAEQALIDVEFYKKVRRAVAVTGMDKFKALMDLAPEVKNVSLAESQNFVATLKTLSNYKKDQARAAKLLLSQVIDESFVDLTVTSSGNLLIP